jgi:hypothetical protein
MKSVRKLVSLAFVAAALEVLADVECGNSGYETTG